jgi:hypothetical protein
MEQFEEKKEKARELYGGVKSLYCPYFKEKVVFNSDGFHHLQFSARRERDKKAQLLKFRLLPLALSVLRDSGTVQEYRTLLAPVTKSSAKGETPLKLTEYFGFVAIVGETKVRVIVRKVGNGQRHFWSVMPHVKMQGGKQKLFAEGVEDA